MSRRRGLNTDIYGRVFKIVFSLRLPDLPCFLDTFFRIGNKRFLVESVGVSGIKAEKCSEMVVTVKYTSHIWENKA